MSVTQLSVQSLIARRSQGERFLANPLPSRHALPPRSPHESTQ